MNMEKRAVFWPDQIIKGVFLLLVWPLDSLREGVGKFLLGDQCCLWFDCCASSLLLLSFNQQLMKKTDTMMVAQCCLRTIVIFLIPHSFFPLAFVFVPHLILNSGTGPKHLCRKELPTVYIQSPLGGSLLSWEACISSLRQEMVKTKL